MFKKSEIAALAVPDTAAVLRRWQAELGVRFDVQVWVGEPVPNPGALMDLTRLASLSQRFEVAIVALDFRQRGWAVDLADLVVALEDAELLT